MAVTQYIGSRYVPIFADPAEWSSAKEYEPLTIVMHEGNSFTSKQFVPVGIGIDNTDFWAETGNYNAQVEAYRNDVQRYHNEFGDFREEIEGDIEDINQGIEDFQSETSDTINQFMEDVNVDYFYDEITLEFGRAEDTDYYIAFVPLLDADGNIIQPTMVKHVGMNPLQNADATGTTLSINGSATIEMSGGTFTQGTVIGNGEILNEHSYAGESTLSPLNYPRYICFDEDREITEIRLDSNPSGQSLIDAGYKNVFQCYAKLATNGIMHPLDDWDPPLEINGTTFTSDIRNPMMLMGSKENKDLYFLACDGRTPLNLGLFYESAVNILISKGCTNVYMMDGGGSTCMVYRGSKINRNIDENGTKVRNISYSLTFNKNTPNETEQKSFGNDGFVRQFTTKQLLDYIHQLAVMPKAMYEIPSNTDINTLTRLGKYQCTSSARAQTMTNVPFYHQSGSNPNMPFDLYVLHYGYFSNMVLQIAVNTTHDTYGYVNRMAYRFVDIVDNTSVSPYVSDWTYVTDKAYPQKITVGGNSSLTIPYLYSRPAVALIWCYGNRAYENNGVIMLTHEQWTDNETPIHIVNNGTAYGVSFTVTMDTTNRTITVNNLSAGRFYGVLCNGFWLD